MKIKYLEWSKDAGEYIGDFVVKTTENNILFKHVCNLGNFMGLEIAVFVDLSCMGLNWAIKDPKKDCYYLYFQHCSFVHPPKHELEKIKRHQLPDYLKEYFIKKPIDIEDTKNFFETHQEGLSNIYEIMERYNITHLFNNEAFIECRKKLLKLRKQK